MEFSACALWASDDDNPRSPHTWITADFVVRDDRIYRTDNPSTQSSTLTTGEAGTLTDPRPRRKTATPSLWMIPGMVDVHCHIGIGKDGPVQGAAMLGQAHAERDAGVLLARDCGVPTDNAWVADRTDTLSLVRAGRHIAKHKRYIRGFAEEVEDVDLPQAMAFQAKRGDGWVKIVGDWIDRSQGAQSDLDPLWSRSALQDGVQAAHEAGARVTVHTFGHKAIDDLLAAGVDCIEHGTGMDADQVKEAAARGIAITPTLMQVALFPQFANAAGSKYPVYANTMMELWHQSRQTQAQFVEVGIHLLPGTDAGGYQDHGRLAWELQTWPQMGLNAREILDFATWKARHFLGFDGLGEGARADFVLFDSDPREDLDALKRPLAVIYRGHNRLNQHDYETSSRV